MENVWIKVEHYTAYIITRKEDPKEELLLHFNQALFIVKFPCDMHILGGSEFSKCCSRKNVPDNMVTIIRLKHTSSILDTDITTS